MDNKQNRTQQQLDQTQHSIDQLGLRQDRTQQQLDQMDNKQNRTQQQLDQLNLKVDRMSDQIDAFVSGSQHYFSKHGESIEQLKGISERLEGLLAYLIRKDDRRE